MSTTFSVVSGYNGRDVLATYDEESTAMATAMQHVCQHIGELEAELSRIKEMIAKGDNGRAFIAYSNLIGYSPTRRIGLRIEYN